MAPDSSGSIPGDQDVQTQLDNGLSSGTYDFSASAHGLFSVTAGAHTFYFNAQELSGGSATMFDLQLTLIFFPTAYGSIVSNFNGGGGGDEFQGKGDPNDGGPVGAGLTLADIDAERAESMAANQARMQRELDDMRAEVEALRALLAETIAAQQAAAQETRSAAPAPAVLEEGAE